MYMYVIHKNIGLLHGVDSDAHPRTSYHSSRASPDSYLTQTDRVGHCSAQLSTTQRRPQEREVEYHIQGFCTRICFYNFQKKHSIAVVTFLPVLFGTRLLTAPNTQKRENATRNSMRRPRRTRVAQLAISYAYVQKNFHSSRFHVIFFYKQIVHVLRY